MTETNMDSTVSGFSAVGEFTELEWTPERVGRFWDFFAANRELHSGYFSNRYGSAILGLAEHHIPEIGVVGDYGCGPGFLVRKYIDAGYKTWALDFSAETLNKVNTTFRGVPLFAGTAPIDSTTQQNLRVNTVFCTETLEHLLSDQLAPTVEFIRDVTLADGHVVITVPHDEKLEVQSVPCPNCKQYFHRWQHITSWQVGDITSLFEQNGFETTFCAATNFSQVVTELERSAFRQMREVVLNVIDTRSHVEWLWHRLNGTKRETLSHPSKGSDPHLIYIGRKTS